MFGVYEISLTNGFLLSKGKLAENVYNDWKITVFLFSEQLMSGLIQQWRILVINKKGF